MRHLCSRARQLRGFACASTRIQEHGGDGPKVLGQGQGHHWPPELCQPGLQAEEGPAWPSGRYHPILRSPPSLPLKASRALGCPCPHQDIPRGFLLQGGFAQTRWFLPAPGTTLKEGQEVSCLLGASAQARGRQRGARTRIRSSYRRQTHGNRTATDGRGSSRSSRTPRGSSHPSLRDGETGRESLHGRGTFQRRAKIGVYERDGHRGTGQRETPVPGRCPQGTRDGSGTSHLLTRAAPGWRVRDGLL